MPRRRTVSRSSKKFLRDINDPLSAMLIPAEATAMAPANCRQDPEDLDGRRRYNLVLSYKRIDKVKMARGYAGAVLVCGVVLRPIGGYKTDSLLVRYLAGKDDLEMWFAPVKGVPFMAPVRALMPTLIGTMDINANEFFVRKTEPAPPKAVETAPAAPVKPVDAAPLAPPKRWRQHRSRRQNRHDETVTGRPSPIERMMASKAPATSSMSAVETTKGFPVSIVSAKASIRSPSESTGG